MRRIFSICFFVIPTALSAQFPSAETSSELYNDLLKASNTARVLYLAAHPDDENTRLIAYFENARHVRTAYLSLNRGAGGQNLIGTEIGPAIGVLRTQELLRARSIDGGEQFFTRAVDFGYSKTAKETFEKWGKQEVLSDVVRIIRQFRPDVIVTRFPTSDYGGHGHHQASAILAEEAFDLAADPNAFPEQLEELNTWQTTRLYFNASSWWNKNIADEARRSDDFVMIDVGEYDPLLGESYAQIAARSRSSHASQGFGADYPYGSSIEFLRYEKGDKVKKGEGLLSDIDQGWSRTSLPKVGEILEVAIADYDFLRPEKSATSIISALRVLRQAKPDPLIEYKTKELENLLIKLADIDMNLYTDKPYTVPGGSLSAQLMVNVASHLSVNVVSINGEPSGEKGKLAYNVPFKVDRTIAIDANSPYSNPYWLDKPFEDMHNVEDPDMIGRPENPPAINVDVSVSIDGYDMIRQVPAQYKTVDPTRGVVLAPVYIVPAITYNFSENVVVSAGDGNRRTELIATSHTENATGDIRLELPEGWKANPEVLHFDFAHRGDKERITIDISRSPTAKSGKMVLKNINGNSVPAGRDPLSMVEIDYPHIPTQIMLKPAQIELAAIDLNRDGVENIGYIEGPGDDVAKYLRAAGYHVTPISNAELTTGVSPRDYDAIVTGIRAFNTRDELVFANEKLNEYVKAGGTWLVQYLTTAGLKTDRIGPYPFTVSRERVTDEGAEARFLAPNHPVMSAPNKLSESDFDGWVQERGLYFAGDWDSAFTPIIGWNDPGEPSRDGGLIVAPYGDGYFVYSGISFFRELPAGVPGAYRLLANILALSKKEEAHHD